MVRKAGINTTVWFLASNWKDMPLAMKCQVNSEKTQIFPNAKPGSPWENMWLPTTSQLHFFALYNLHLGPIETMAAGN